MLVNLRNGTTISISSERYFAMSDEELDRLELYYRGAEVNDPFYASILDKPGSGSDEDEDTDEEEDE